MKYNICKITCWLASLLMVANGTTSAQEKSDVFRARFAATRNAAMNISVTKSDTIDLSHYLNARAPIYSLSVDAAIEQPREASFTRIVLEDSEGHDHLVLECDRFRYDQDVVHLSEFCQETALLFGIIPSRLKCYVSGDAQLTLCAVYTTDQRPLKGIENTSERQEIQHNELRREQAQDIVERINSYNQNHSKLWRAGVTDCAMSTPLLYDGDSYTENLKYYESGIYEMGEQQELQHPIRSSTMIESFDWRNRHGKNWITGPKSQGSSNLCTAFTAVAAVEAVTNLYFNNTVNLNLSAQDVAYYSHQPIYGNVYYFNGQPVPFSYHTYYTYGGWDWRCLEYMKSTGTMDSISCPFQDTAYPTMPTPRPYGNEYVQITDYHGYPMNSDSVDATKRRLIQKGPAIAGYYRVTQTGGTAGHAMCLIGYGRVQQGDNLTDISSSGYMSYYPNVPLGDPRIGMTYWIHKNSNSETDGHGKYLYMLYHDYSYMGWVYFIDLPIIWRNHDASDIVVEDNDYDGYFNWGIGPRPDDRLPSWAFQEEDGDDNDDSTGKMDEYGRFYDTIHDGILVNSYMTITNDRFLRGGIAFNSNKILTLKGTIVCHPQCDITFANNDELVINGGTLVDPTFVLDGIHEAKVTLKNGGEIVFTSKKGSFSPPLGLNLEILNGNIRYVQNYW